MGRVTIGVDPGKLADPAAVVVVEHQNSQTDTHYAVRAIEHPATGTSYTTLRDRLVEMDRKLSEVHGVKAEYRIEANGCGEPFLDMLRETRLRGRIVTVWTTGSSKVLESRDGRELSIGKAPLITQLVTLLEQGRVHLPNTAEAAALTEELEDFGRETTRGAVKYEAETGHDDLVIALALAVWRKKPRKVARWGWGPSESKRDRRELFPGLRAGGKVTVRRPMDAE